MMKKISLYLMSFFYVMAGFNHFMNPDFYLKMIPSYLPAPEALNVISGSAEMLLGMMLIRPEVRSLAAWGIILLLIAIFPANIYMYQQGGNAFGVPDWSLLLRLPLQLVLLAWAYWHTKNPDVDRHTIQTEIVIAAPAEKIWRELTAFDRYSEWNPFIVRARGGGQLRDRMEVAIRPPDAGEFKFKNTIIERVENQSLAWLGSFIFKGLFDGTHYFVIEKRPDGSCLFIHGEKFEGVLVKVLSGLLGGTQKGFVLMNEALKARCEHRT